ncbi:cryptochrome/photolyase family protein [Actibacterium ureilyticum]|uniref:cryptochrome/photolyase family protein n=1 Tax=Actibacterium ureilyticum TaxID=1590614 RepID=UPI000BAAC6F1|nr:cryptochrome/photolyase family protein [Actibacterium ureilyticum]
MVGRLILVLGDQLSPEIAALREGDKAHDIVVMAEVGAEATYVAHHPKKIAFILAAMRKFAARLHDDGWQVAYTRLDDPENTGALGSELLRRASETGLSEVLTTEPGEWRVIDLLDELPLPVTQLPDDRFITLRTEFADWAKGRKTLRMEHFYRTIRRRTGLLMDEDAPAGGKWNYDHQNRKPAQNDLFALGPLRHQTDKVTDDVLDLVEDRFGDHFGQLRPFWFATDAAGAEAARDHFLKHALPLFGDFQDAMLDQDRFLYHAVLSPYLNVGLLDPLDLCRRAETEWREGRAPLNAVEGFIRQIIGWREFIRGIYFLQGPDYTRRNTLNHRRKLPDFYWGGETHMHCVGRAVEQTRDEAYAHHIQRLMITGNFGLLAGIDPGELHQWYLAVYADAFEWVEAPNTLGMSQFADGGIVASKPYVSSGSYIDRMSDYCSHCHYDVKQRSGEKACPFNALYWGFLDRHRKRFAKNPRMAQMYSTWDRMDADTRDAILSRAEDLRDRLSRGTPI